MKRKISFAAALIFSWAAGFVAFSQDVIPDDPETIIGKLDNGLTYYIRHNENPKACADFYIVHNVGALQEEDNQNGLAHFLEHMAFNGTRHYPGKTMLEFLAKDGVRFGYNVNAYTSKYETVYNISSVPLVRESFIDSVLTVIHDWSCDISCVQEELDNERGVISEEWRRSDDSRSRMYTKQNNLIYRGSKYTQRTVLGSLEVINGFKREEILDFYHKWYRPDLQAIVVVGDFDAKEMEQTVIRKFSDIPASENPAPKELYPVPDQEGPLFENITDPDIRYFVLKVICKNRFMPRELRNTRFYVKDLLLRQIVTSAVEDRFSAAAKMPGSPAKSAVLVTSRLFDDFYSSMFTISPKSEDLLLASLDFYSVEMKRLLEHGISAEEFEDAKFKVYKRLKLNNEITAIDIKNKNIVDACKEHFLRGFACVLPDEMQRIQKEILAEISYDEAGEYLKKMFVDGESIYSYSINENKADLLPSIEQMKKAVEDAQNVETKPAFLTNNRLDLSVDVKPGRIVKEKAIKVKGYAIDHCELWTLGNGAKLYYIPSDKVVSPTHVFMKVSMPTGCRSFPQESVESARFASNYIGRYACFRGIERNKMKNYPEFLGVDNMVSIGQSSSYVKLMADKDHAENGFKSVYLQLAEPSFPDNEVFLRFKQGILNDLKQEKSESMKFDRIVTDARFGKHPYLTEVTSSHVEPVDMDFVKEIYDRSFTDYSKMTIYLASDLDRDFIREMVEKYIASLEGDYAYKIAKVKSSKLIYKGKKRVESRYPLKTVPKSDVKYYFRYPVSTSPKDRLCVDVLDYILSERYFNQIREVRGGTYYVNFMSSQSMSTGECESYVEFQTRPEMMEVLIQDVEDGMAEICRTAPSAGELEDAVRYFVKRHSERQHYLHNTLSDMASQCADYIEHGIVNDFDYEEVLRSITPEDVRKLAVKTAKGNKLITVYVEDNQ